LASTYYTKKKTRKTDELGRILNDPDNIAEPIGWGSGKKLQLAVQVLWLRDTSYVGINACTNRKGARLCPCAMLPYILQ
jgi:hypothetical protein